MPTALLIGFPPNYINAAKAVIANDEARFSGWTIKYIPGSGRASGITQRDLEKIPDYADRHHDLHIIGFSEDSTRREVADKVAPYFRFRWFRYELLRMLRSQDPSPFVEGLAKALTEEMEWTARVKPSTTNSPLLLPECAFKCARNHADLWRHALAYGDIENIIGAEMAIRDFRATHHQKVIFQNSSRHKWVDTSDLVFDENGARHGIAPYPRNWKFSYRIEAGFHYDVTHAHGMRFSVEDSQQRKHVVNPGAHLNIDPHGFVRG